MPYIKKDDGRREALRLGDAAKTAGELNYQMFYYIKHQPDFDLRYNDILRMVVRFLGEKPNYQRYNDMTGALIRCAVEVERRLKKEITVNTDRAVEILLEVVKSFDNEIARYEDLKIKENGDVE